MKNKKVKSNTLNELKTFQQKEKSESFWNLKNFKIKKECMRKLKSKNDEKAPKRPI